MTSYVEEGWYWLERNTEDDWVGPYGDQLSCLAEAVGCRVQWREMGDVIPLRRRLVEEQRRVERLERELAEARDD